MLTAAMGITGAVKGRGMDLLAERADIVVCRLGGNSAGGEGADRQKSSFDFCGSGVPVFPRRKGAGFNQ